MRCGPGSVRPEGAVDADTARRMGQGKLALGAVENYHRGGRDPHRRAELLREIGRGDDPLRRAEDVHKYPCR